MELQELKLSIRVLAFANKHYTSISTTCYLYRKHTLFQSQSSDCTVHNKFAFMNYTDREHSAIKNNNIAGIMVHGMRSQTL